MYTMPKLWKTVAGVWGAAAAGTTSGSSTPLKANPNLSIVGFLRNLVDGADVSSLREMYIAAQARFKPESMYPVGPSKSHEEVSEAVRGRIGCLVVESEKGNCCLPNQWHEASRVLGARGASDQPGI